MALNTTREPEEVVEQELKPLLVKTATFLASLLSGKALWSIDLAFATRLWTLILVTLGVFYLAYLATVLLTGAREQISILLVAVLVIVWWAAYSILASRGLAFDSILFDQSPFTLPIAVYGTVAVAHHLVMRPAHMSSAMPNIHPHDRASSQ